MSFISLVILELFSYGLEADLGVTFSMDGWDDGHKNKLKEAKLHKYTQSQTRLDIPIIKYIPVSPREYQEFRTERVMPKLESNQENIEISPF